MWNLPNTVYILWKMIKKGENSMAKQMNVSAGRPARTTEGRESQIISLAYNEAERQILEGTASSQIITYFLKLGSEKEKQEREKLRNENELLKAKVKAIESSQTSDELYANAIAAMKKYSGND